MYSDFCRVLKVESVLYHVKSANSAIIANAETSRTEQREFWTGNHTDADGLVYTTPHLNRNVSLILDVAA